MVKPKRRITHNGWYANFNRGVASVLLATFLILLMFGTDELVQLVNLLSVELHVLKEQVNLIEAIGCSGVLHYIRPVPNSDIFGMVMMQALVVTCKKYN